MSYKGEWYDNQNAYPMGGEFAVKGVVTMKIDDSETAGDTRFFLYDVDTDTLVRVTTGANDSGGSGLRALTIPNTP